MLNRNEELQRWHDWTSPDFFETTSDRETPVVPLFLRQLLPVRFQKTKLTMIGWMLVIVAMGIGSAAYNTASNILFMTLSLLLSSLVLSGILSLINFRSLQWSMGAPRHLQVGEVGMAEVEVRNNKQVFPTLGICFEVGSSASDKAEHLYLNHAIKAGDAVKLDWTFIPRKRGRCEIFLSGVESQFPFGFLKKIMGHELREEVLVWPQQIDYMFTLENNGQRILSGNSKRNAGLGSDLLNLRPYAPGDPPRLVHWKATARLGKLMIRQLAQEGEGGYHLILDTDSQQWNDEVFETLCSLVCSLADALFHAGRLETVVVNGASPLSIRGLRDLHDFYDCLALLETVPHGVASVEMSRGNQITFRPLGERGVAIYVDETQAGQTHD
ncbi:MAG: DUF58 domain-containing protein [Opitutaceae bacterium]